MAGPAQAAPVRPVPSVTVAGLLLRCYAEHASSVAVVDGDRQVTYAELGQSSSAVSTATCTFRRFAPHSSGRFAKLSDP